MEKISQTKDMIRDNNQRVVQEIKCWIYRTIEYTKSQCPNEKNRVCWICNKEGHVRKN